MKENEGWAFKNKHGLLLMWSIGETRRGVLEKVYSKFLFRRSLKSLEADGYKIVKVKIIEI